MVIKNLHKKQISSLLKLSKFLIKKYKVKSENILGHSDISPQRKKDPGEKFPWEHLSKNEIGIWHTLNKQELKKNRKLETSREEKNFFFNNLFKIGYSKKPLADMNKAKYLRELAKNFSKKI